jgi:antitoxin component YwqK of YwqJK toxin-antitoxin module
MKHQDKHSTMANLLNKHVRPVVLSAFVISSIFTSCNNKSEKQSAPKTEQNPTTQVDTLGGNFKRVVKDKHNDGRIRTVHYYRDSNNYFERKLWPSGKDYIRGWIKNGAREGTWYSWYENGVLWSSGIYKNGLRQGKSNLYYDNGSVQQVQEYKDGKPHGTWKFYDEQKNLILEVDYNKGEKIEERRYGD